MSKRNRMFVCYEHELIDRQDEVNALFDEGWEICFFDKLAQDTDDPVVMIVLELERAEIDADDDTLNLVRN